jgi:hypothetical protein
VRCFTFLVVVCFTVTTAFSTTFPLKSSSPYHNNNLKSLSEWRSQVLEEEAKTTTPKVSSSTGTGSHNERILAKPTGSTNLIPPPEPNEQDDDKAQTNDTVEKKEEEKMQTADDQKFKERIQSSIRTVQNWENVEWLQECRTVIPWDDLRNATGPYSNPENDRLLADDSNAIFLQRLCRWFPKFMTWVNAPPCVKCGCKECEMKTVRGPETEEEKQGSAKRVEGRLPLARAVTRMRSMRIRATHLFPFDQSTTALNVTRTLLRSLVTIRLVSLSILERAVVVNIPTCLACSAGRLALKRGSSSI